VLYGFIFSTNIFQSDVLHCLGYDSITGFQACTQDSKFNILLNKSKENMTYIVGLSLKSKEYFVMQVKESTKHREIHSHPFYGGKPAIEIEIKNMRPYSEFGQKRNI
jgi:hypothetical protein